MLGAPGAAAPLHPHILDSCLLSPGSWLYCQTFSLTCFSLPALYCDWVIRPGGGLITANLSPSGWKSHRLQKQLLRSLGDTGAEKQSWASGTLRCF